MTNQEKFLKMGLNNLPSGRKNKILVSETRPFTESRTKFVENLVIHNGDHSPDSVFHNVNTCMTIDEVGEFTNNSLEIHYCNHSWQDAVRYAMANNIKVINRSASFSFNAYNAEHVALMQEFIDWGGIFVCAGGNDPEGNNEPTDVDNNYFISVGTVHDSDNSGTTICSYSGWDLPSLNGSNNRYTHTSSASPSVAAVTSILQGAYGYNKYQVEDFFKVNAKGKEYEPSLEAGETLLYIPKLDNPCLMKLKIGDKNIHLPDGTVIPMPQAPFIKAENDPLTGKPLGKTFVPLREPFEALGYTVVWRHETQEIEIYEK